MAHPLGTALALSLGANGWQWHEGLARQHRSQHQISQWRNAFAGERAGFAALNNQNSDLRGELARQNAAITGMARASAARQASAAAALAGAEGQARRAAQRAAALRAAANSPRTASEACQTPTAVLAQRASL